MKRITQAIILAAGEGQRLKPFTTLMPKVMLRLAHKPILQYVIEALAQNGIRRIVMVVGYKKEQIQDYFGSGNDFGVEIEYVIQPQQLGVAHALKQTENITDDRFLVIAGDNMIEANTISPLMDSDTNAMLIKMNEDTSRYKTVDISDGIVRDIFVDTQEKEIGPVDIGAYVFDKKIFQFIGEEVQLTPVIQKMLSAGHTIAACRADGIWQDTGYPWDILRLNDICISKVAPSLGGNVEDGTKISGDVSIGDGTTIRSNSYIIGPVVIGENCEIGPGVCIFPSTSIGNEVIVSPFSVIKNSSIWDNVSIGPGSSIQDSIIASGTSIGSHFATRSGESFVKIEDEHHKISIGAIIGSYCNLGDNVIVEPGNIIGNNCQIRAMKVIGENIPDGGLVV